MKEELQNPQDMNLVHKKTHDPVPPPPHPLHTSGVLFEDGLQQTVKEIRID